MSTDWPIPSADPPPPDKTGEGENLNPYEYFPPVVQQPLAARFAPSTPRPRIWTAIVVGILTVIASFIVALMTGIVAALSFLDPAVHFRNPELLEQAVKDFVTTPAGFFVMVLPGQLTFFVMALIATRLSPVPFKQRLRLTRGSMPIWTWVLFAIATPGVGLAISYLLSLFFKGTSSNMEMLNDAIRAQTGPFLWVMVAMIGFLPGICEELIFRGYVQSRLLQRLPAIWAILITTVLFAVAHFDPLHVLAVLPAGIWLGVVAWRADSIYPSMMCHTVNNAASVLASYYSTTGALEVELDVPTIALLVISCPALVLSCLVLCLYRTPTATKEVAAPALV